MKKIINSFICCIIVCSSFLLNGCGFVVELWDYVQEGCNDYTGWYESEVPTMGEYRASLKIPNEWHFDSYDNRVIIKDTKGELIATEIYYGARKTSWGSNYNKPDGTVDVTIANWDELDINYLEGYELDNINNYSFIWDYDSKAVWQYSDGVHTNYCVEISIYEKNKIEYYLSLIFLNDISYEDAQKIGYSLHWGGWYE